MELYSLCRNVLDRLELNAQKNHISLSCEGESVSVTGIPRIMEEIIYNLCDNAIKYNRPDGFVKVFLSRTETFAVVHSLTRAVFLSVFTVSTKATPKKSAVQV